MKTAIARLKSVSPLSWSRRHNTPKEDREGDDAWEKRTWRNRLHKTKDGYVFLPPMAFKLALDLAAHYRDEKIPGKGNMKYKKHFKSGVLCPEGVTLDIKAKDVEGEWHFVPANGQKGGGKRVDRCFPVIHEWEGDVTFIILDDTITEEVFERHLAESGAYIGIGRFRPERQGFYGRFEVVNVRWN